MLHYGNCWEQKSFLNLWRNIIDYQQLTQKCAKMIRLCCWQVLEFSLSFWCNFFCKSVQPTTHSPQVKHARCTNSGVSGGKQVSVSQLPGIDKGTVKLASNTKGKDSLGRTNWKRKHVRCTFFPCEHQRTQGLRSKPPSHTPVKPKHTRKHLDITNHRPGKRGCPLYDRDKKRTLKGWWVTCYGQEITQDFKVY